MLAMALALCGGAALAGESVLYSFQGGSDGAAPHGELLALRHHHGGRRVLGWPTHS